MMTTESTGAQNFIPRPRKTFYHPNAKGTGTALRLELHPAHEETEGSIFATLASQRSVTERTADGGVSFASFDWTNAICLKLDLMDLAQMLDVFHGLRESAGEGKGLFHRSANATAVIRLEHNLEPVEGYLLDVSKKKTGEEAARRLHFFLNLVHTDFDTVGKARSVSNDNGRSFVGLCFFQCLYKLICICSHSTLSNIYVAVGHEHCTKILLL
jgi:hypothetical protein